jgi:Na+-exporting ATPase
VSLAPLSFPAVERQALTGSIALSLLPRGDIILVKNGDVVPADARCLPDELSALETDEALLTGESLPVSKHDRILDEPDCPVGDRKNMVFSGSQVTKGRGRCIVVNTGMRTELGKIAEAMERKETTNHKGWAAKWYRIKCAMGTAGTTPLQIKLNTIAYILLGFALLLAFIVVASTAFTDVPFSIATYAVATAVSILPASLIAVVSLTLANATRELAARNALVRRMDAVEALGAVTDICSDKTGTITVGKMVLKKAWLPANGIRPDDRDWAPIDTVTGQAYTAESGSDPFYPRGIVRSAARRAVQTSGTSTPTGSSSDDSDDDMDAEDVIRPSQMEEGLKNLVLCASLCNTATIHHSDDNRWEANGDATEIALQVFAHKLGHGQPHLTHTKKSHAVQTQGEFLSPQTTRTDDKVTAVNPAKVALAGHYAKIVEHPFDSCVLPPRVCRLRRC